MMTRNKVHYAAGAALLASLFAGPFPAAGAAEDNSVYPGFPRFLTLEFQGEGSGAAMEPPQELSDYLATVETGNLATILAYASERPSSPFADDALLEAARLLLSRGDQAAAVQLFQRVWSRHQDGVRLDQTYRKVWFRYEDGVRVDQRYREFAGRGKIYPEEIERYKFYREHIGRHPNLSSDMAMVELGRLYVTLGKPGSAYGAFRQVVERYPEGQFSSEDEEAMVVICFDPNRPFAEALWYLAEAARLREEEGAYGRYLQRVVDLYPCSARGLQAFDSLVAYWDAHDNAGRAQALKARKLEILKGLAKGAEEKGFRLRAAEYRLEINRIRGDNKAEYSGNPILDSDSRSAKEDH